MTTFVGTTRPITPTLGEMRFNTTTNCMEVYSGGSRSIMTSGSTGEYRLDVSEGKVAGARYYTVEPVNAAFTWGEMMSWTVESFGPTVSIWESSNARWYANNAKFWFRNKKDCDWFILRWAS